LYYDISGGGRMRLMALATLAATGLIGTGWLAASSPQDRPVPQTTTTPRPPGGIPTGPPIAATFERAMITAPPEALGLDPFYKKYTDAFGIPVVSSEKVDDAALLMARDIVNYMLLKRPDVRDVMISRKSRLLVMARVEGEMDLPERRDWKKPARDDRRLTDGERRNYDGPNGIANMTDAQYWNQRARGMGGNITSCAEENLLGLPGTRYYGEHITVHEFSHNIMGALRVVEPALVREVEAAFEAAKAKGLYKNSRGQAQYAINTVAEYWAEGTQWWFWSNIEFYDGTTGARVQSPDDLKAYDPALYAILDRVYAGHHIPADVYYGKNLRPQAAGGILPAAAGLRMHEVSSTSGRSRRPPHQLDGDDDQQETTRDGRSRPDAPAPPVDVTAFTIGTNTALVGTHE
jgi:hypothetical protein